MNTPVDPKAAEATATQVATIPPRRQDILPASDPIPVLDTAKFEQMQRVANVMAWSAFIPDSLRKRKEGNVWVDMDPREIISNCFMVVNQASRWGMDPFAVAQCVSVVHGKLCYEGKLIAGLIDAKLGIRLHYDWAGEGENMRIRVSGTFRDGTTESIDGSVVEWKTKHPGSPWTPLQYRKMLAYRGSREWARLYAPGLMLGIYTPDEMDALTGTRVSDGARYEDEPEALPPPKPRRVPPPPPTIAQSEAPPTAPAAPEKPATATAEATFVDLVKDEPASRQEPGQSSPGATGKASPAAATASQQVTPAAGEDAPQFASYAQLLDELGQCETVMAVTNWSTGLRSEDIGNLDGAEGRELQKAIGNRSAHLGEAEKKKK